MLKIHDIDMTRRITNPIDELWEMRSYIYQLVEELKYGVDFREKETVIVKETETVSPTPTPVPGDITKLSQLQNDVGFVTDTYVRNGLTGKVDKVDGKGLSANDFTTELKTKLDSIASGAEVNVQADWNQTTTTADDYIKNKPTIPSEVTESTVSGWGFTKNNLALGETSTTAYRGDRGKMAYDHSQTQHAPADAEKNVKADWTAPDFSDSAILNKPSIPSKTSDLTNDSDYITSSELGSKQDTLVSGINLKTINEQSLLGSGNITISGGGGGGLSFDDIYPVGSIYTSVNSTDPSTLFGGTWERIKDTFLLAAGDTYTAGEEGGSANAVVVSHRHATAAAGQYFVTSETSSASNQRFTPTSSGTRYTDAQTSVHAHHASYTASAGESGTGKNMPPYITVNVWKRTA